MVTLQHFLPRLYFDSRRALLVYSSCFSQNSTVRLESPSFPRTMATTAARLLANPQGYAEAAKKIQSGEVVAFPTETVYGLGASALNETAVRKIFEYKGRPLTDPLIVHVSNIEQALELVELGGEKEDLFIHLAKRFWPGPLTLIAKATCILPSCITAETGFVGVRIPNHPVALSLLQESKLPIAAPSANRFGHVSPTSAEHVLSDLGQCPISVLDGGTTCDIGIESTVVKIDPVEQSLIVFRRGGVSDHALQDSLGERFQAYKIKVLERSVPLNGSVQQQAPGGLITHYAPEGLITFMIRGENDVLNFPSVTEDLSNLVSESVVLDFNGSLKSLSQVSKSYRDLSPSGNVSEAATCLFDALRWTETVTGATHVLLPDVSAVNHEHASAVHDRLFRAASGRVIRWDQIKPRMDKAV